MRVSLLPWPILALLTGCPAEKDGAADDSASDDSASDDSAVDSAPDCPDEALVYTDADGDGFGDPASAVSTCEPEADDLRIGGDCDDADSGAYPGATEICGDGKVNDCSGGLEGASETCPLVGLIDLADADVVILGDEDYDLAGAALAGLGDVNGDGLADILVGAPGSDIAAKTAGAAALVLGPVSGTLSLSDAVVLTGESVDLSAGGALAGPGDVDGDGYDDLWIGAESADDPASNAGAGWLVSGPAVAGSLADAGGVLRGDGSGDRLGYALAGAGDVDGDGLADLLAGAYGADGETRTAGAAVLWLGPASGESLASDADALLLGSAAGDQAGAAVASAGDVDGDGLADVLVGVPRDDTTDDDAGAAALLLGPLSGSVAVADADLLLLGEATHDYAGSALAGGADIDGDGLDDLAVGSADNDDGGADAGSVCVISGPTRGALALPDAGALRYGLAAGDGLGGALSVAGDVDGDSFADLIVGARGDAVRGVATGAAWLIYGPVSGDSAVAESNAARLIGLSNTDHAGESVAGAGDLDGDGLPDLLVGAPQAEGGGLATGAAYALFGGRY